MGGMRIGMALVDVALGGSISSLWNSIDDASSTWKNGHVQR
jgi:hypothetical protein